VIQNKYQKESSLYQLLVDKGFEVFYPRLRVNPVNPRSKKERPYFPGYMFVYTDLSKVQLRTFQRMPYAIGLVNFGGEPATVPEHVIDTIRKNLDELNLDMSPNEKFTSGEAVKVLNGPFSGYEGIFDKSLAGEARVQILLSLLNDKKILLELSAADVAKQVEV
jgi:transcriptional antiterminator RfaH